jgi:hypothetical protein
MKQEPSVCRSCLVLGGPPLEMPEVAPPPSSASACFCFRTIRLGPEQLSRSLTCKIMRGSLLRVNQHDLRRLGPPPCSSKASHAPTKTPPKRLVCLRQLRHGPPFSWGLWSCIIVGPPPMLPEVAPPLAGIFPGEPARGRATCLRRCGDACSNN